MTYLITGGCGFLGSNVAAHLIEAGHRAIVFDNLARHGASENLKWLRTLGKFEFVHGDTRNFFDLEPLLRTPGLAAVFHLAGQVAMTTSLKSPRKDFEINVLGTINLLEAMREHAPEAAVVYASSNKVYGDLSFLDLVEGPTRYSPRAGGRGVDESAPLEFHTPYGCSKGAADQYMLDYARGFGLKTVVFRHSTIFGGRQYATFDQGWVGWFVRQAIELQGNPGRPAFTISGDGKQVRDLLHVNDAVAAYLAAVNYIEAAKGQAFNIGGGMENSFSLLELFQHLEKRLGVTMKYERLPWRQSDQKLFVADNAKATRLLEWKPQVTKEQGIESVIAWEQECSSIN
jgi:CDP-paratose 2-epimerase